MPTLRCLGLMQALLLHRCRTTWPRNGTASVLLQAISSYTLSRRLRHCSLAGQSWLPSSMHPFAAFTPCFISSPTLCFSSTLWCLRVSSHHCVVAVCAPRGIQSSVLLITFGSHYQLPAIHLALVLGCEGVTCYSQRGRSVPLSYRGVRYPVLSMHLPI